MATRTLHSNSILFVDQTDSRTLTVSLTANKAVTQIYNPNTNEYIPSWTTENKLIITPAIFVDSSPVIISNASVTWTCKNGIDGTLTNLSTTLANGQQVVGANLQVSQNVLSECPIITYICSVTYENLTASAQIVFTRSDVGVNGHGINIIGMATSAISVSGTNYYTITYGSNTLAASRVGDAYLYDGNLYVCAEMNGEGNDYFVNAGRVQGPTGQSAKNITLNATGQIFSVNKVNVVSPARLTIKAIATNTEVTIWSYSTDGGTTFSTSVPTGVSRDGNIVTVIGANMSSNSLAICASDGIYSDTLSVYKIKDGSDGSPGSIGESAPIMFLTNENITFNAEDDGLIDATTVSTNIVAFRGATAIMPQVGEITGIVSGMTFSLNTIPASREQTLTLTITAGSSLNGTSGYLAIPVSIPSYIVANTYDSSLTYYADQYGSALASQPNSETFSSAAYYKINTSVSPVATNLKLYWNKVISAPEGIGERMSAAEVLITQNIDGISQKVSKNSIISEINQSAEEVKIAANKIKFELGGENNTKGQLEVYDENDTLIGAINKNGFEFIVSGVYVGEDTYCGDLICGQGDTLTPNSIATHLNTIQISVDNAHSAILTKVSSDDFATYRLQTSQEISSKVTKGRILSEINQSAEAIKIAASKISLEGITTVNNNFTIDRSGNVSVNGNITASSGSIAGFTIGSGGCYSNSIYKRTSNGGASYEVGMKATSGYTDYAFYVRRSTDNWANSSVMFAVGNQGRLQAEDAVIKGSITAISGTIGGCSISGGVLQISAANISSGTIATARIPNLSASKITSGTISAARISSLNANTVLGSSWAIDDDGLYARVAGVYSSGYTSLKPNSFTLRNSGTSSSIFVNMTGGAITCNGQYTASWANIISGSSYSDRRLKDDICNIDDKYDKLFDSLTPRKYRYKHETDTPIHTGFIAQEVEESIDGAGLTANDFSACIEIPEYNDQDELIANNKCLKYDEFISLNTWQIQKLKERVSALERLLQSKEN